MHTTWVLVSDRARARLFEFDAEGEALTELQDFINPDGRKPGAAGFRDRKPRVQESASSARHAIEPHTTPEQKASDRFAHELGAVLERGRVDHRYERLILAAPPHFLGDLQQHLGKQVQACVVARLSKDLTALPLAQIKAHLPAAPGG